MRLRRSLPSWLPTLAVAILIFVAVSWAKSSDKITVYWYQVIQLAAIMAISALGLNLIYGFNGQFSLGHIGFYAIGAYGSALITKDFVGKWSGEQVGALSWLIAGQVGLVVAIVLGKGMRINAIRQTVRSWEERYLHPSESWILPFMIGAVLLAVALAVGAAATWLLHKGIVVALAATLLKLPPKTAEPILFGLALINGGTMAALVAYLVGLPLLRLGSDYFGIATLGFAVMIYTALQNSDTVIPTMKGARGMVAIPRWTTWGWVFAALVLSLIIMRNLIYSSHGRAIRSVREDE
ncbi:MAG: hypothetical protein H5T69_08900, partial [Chloroflexi bacterium]|nr:hypothetical protein [Chloroflexota bacterium]